MKRVSKDCPFSIEELDEFRAIQREHFVSLLQRGSLRLGSRMAEARYTSK